MRKNKSGKKILNKFLKSNRQYDKWNSAKVHKRIHTCGRHNLKYISNRIKHKMHTTQ